MNNNLSLLMGRERMPVSELHKATGISASTLHNIYHEKTQFPDTKTVKTLCDYFDVTFDEFFGIREISFKEKQTN
ncbi:putative phage protein [Staphylococcus equorum subsp. equorum Mu2]|uniref:helix-turn-helix domain-containing protein n=1 Tax=Staphylococcus equorum TaxID=246432 RepID=UPI000267DEA8|nr:helix-turn-helix transcriptional regulator [Staphylococcus equorum]CCI60789.1 putative phage protein [Staphylococcus equorum subsp. equorum Mu2]